MTEGRTRSSFYTRAGKRFLDLALTLPIALLLLPVMLVVAGAVRFSLGSPVLFRQRRPGLRGEPFEILKFRTMRDAQDENGKPLADEQRLNRLGGFLRRTSLDELPGLWNVLRGELGLVGPRPLRMRYLPRYNAKQARRHEIRPGITGWAQIHGRNALTWEEKFDLDVWYVDHVSLWLDLAVLARTLRPVLKGEGTSAPGHATMPEFLGSGPEEREGGRSWP